VNLLPRVARGPGWLLGLAALVTACSEPPSIVLVTLDTVRCDHLGIQGDGRRLSPNLDDLGRSGLVHEHAFTTMPTTAPAHVSLFTGLYPLEHGVRANGERLSGGAVQRSLAPRLRERGYATGAFVTSRILGPDATGLPGFEVYDAPRGALRPGREAARAALQWLDEQGSGPFFLWLHLYDAHAPYGSPDEKRRNMPVDRSRYGFVDTARVSEADRKRRRALYAEGVREADAALGVLLEGLDGRLEQTPLVVVTGDHGEALDEHLETRGYAFDHGEFLDRDVVCVPLVLAGPGVSSGRSTAPVSLVDVYATLLRAAEAGAPVAAADLRTASDEENIVAVERRRLGRGEDDWMRRHTAAAFDARHGVIVSDAGEVFGETPDTPESQALRAVASRHLPGDAAPTTKQPPLDPKLRKTLEALGYVE
jgi:arylsulfatase A-like enzyme